MKAWQLLSKPKTWIQGDEALTKDGYDTSPTSANAVQFCALGAIIKCYPRKELQSVKLNKLEHYLETHRIFKQYGSITEWNDDERRRRITVIKTLKRLHI